MSYINNFSVEVSAETYAVSLIVCAAQSANEQYYKRMGWLLAEIPLSLK